MTRALVTGGSGYFGSLLVERLLSDGHAVRTLDLNPPDDRAGDVDFHRADIRDADAVRRACADRDIVYHCVAQVPLARDKELFRTVNVDGTRNLLDAARHADVGKVVYTSSSAVFGVPRTNPVTESTAPRPLEAYGRAKLEGEALCASAVRDGLDVTVVRPRTILGHGRLGIMAILFEWVADGSSVYVFGRGDNRYQFVHADDLADACVRAAGRPGPAVYNIGAAEFGTMRQSLEALVEAAGTGSRVRSLPTRGAALAMRGLASLGLVPFAPYHWLLYGESLWFDISAARDGLGWSPRWSNEAMLIDSYRWFLAHRDELATAGRSHHRSPVPQRALRLLKRVS
jgi:nucleoside-diphosphate-sugar epimerase